jgi:hypothetical protein
VDRVALDDGELFEWGGADLPSFRQARLDAAMAEAEQRHHGGQHRTPAGSVPLDGRMALVTVLGQADFEHYYGEEEP